MITEIGVGTEQLFLAFAPFFPTFSAPSFQNTHGFQSFLSICPAKNMTGLLFTEKYTDFYSGGNHVLKKKRADDDGDGENKVGSFRHGKGGERGF